MARSTFVVFLLLAASILKASDYVPRDYVWTTQSRNSSESMPCGGHDIGMNIWVEGGDILMYISQSGWFDENNTLLKAGRWRLHIDGNPFGGADFRQTLHLDQGHVTITGGGAEVTIWADVFHPTVFLDIHTRQKTHATLSYESWRYKDRPLTKAECQQCSYKWLVPKDCITHADQIEANGQSLSVKHHNASTTVFDYTVSYERLDAIKDSLYNPLEERTMALKMKANGFTFTGTSDGQYASTDYRSWNFSNNSLRNGIIEITLDNGEGLSDRPPRYVKESRKRSARWWHSFWQRSWIEADGSSEEASRMVRNYELMRYMLGCNAYGKWPTKFNGGLFTFDPVYVEAPGDDGQPSNPFTPDYRKWGGGTMTAQNQRLVYWPMLKSGDYDMMEAQWDTYLRMLPTAMARTRHYWGHGGASFTEQLENFGLPNPAEYGKHKEGQDWGVERNAWLEYEWDTVLEFCQMIVEAERHACPDSATAHPQGGITLRHYSRYKPLIDECLKFFDEHYQYEALRLGAKALDGDGHLVIYPGSGCETYKMAYNPSSTIAALLSLAAGYADSPLPLERIPSIPLHTIGNDTCIAPAKAWARIQNTETPQLYPVFPWRIYGLGRANLQTAINTYMHDPHALDMRSAKGWKQDNIWAACLGLTDEAVKLNREKLDNGPYRFPAFWEPGFDWAPDHNRGGAAMIGLQEMLLQETPDGGIILFPSWPREWNVRFRLHATGGRIVEGTLVNGKVESSIFLVDE